MRIEVIASGSTGNCYWVSDGHTHLLLDCGIPRQKIMGQLHQRGLQRPDAVLVSHEHQDHSKAVKDLLRVGIDVWMSKGTANGLGLEHPMCEFRYGLIETIGSWRVFPFTVEHDASEPMGFLLQSDTAAGRLLYATDAQYVNPRLGDGCTILALEANFSLEKIKANVASGEVDRARKHRTMWNHQSIDTVLKFLKETDRSRLQEVWLLHLSDANADEQLFKRMVQEVTGCRVQIA